MCGIFAAISASAPPEASDHVRECLCSRGPDHTGTVNTRVSDTWLKFTSTVLALRGTDITRQPLVDGNGSVLCWNGEVWRLAGRPISGNDGEAVLRALTDADDILQVLRSIEGPFAFVYLDKPAKRVYYGRDRLGRRSLLIKHGSPLLLASLADVTPGWVEVEADGCYSIDIDGERTTQRHDWAEQGLMSGIGQFNETIPSELFKLRIDSPSVDQLQHHLVESLKLRLLGIPLPPRAAPTDSRVAVLFSGGLDCTVLARLAHDIVPSAQSIDLINVAFENPRIAMHQKVANLYEICPDRITARKAFAELLQVCPRSWRFVTVDIPYAMTCEHRPQIIRLMYPHNTEMDLSIACALYFASRGQGRVILHPDDSPLQYETKARVLLSGLGADELFGGYVRHGSAFERQGYASLIEELKLDVSRLGQRNLGRDDRVMSHWGKEVRFPYLDETVVKWAIEAPVWDKCDFANSGPDQELDPEKRVLRLLAKWLGLHGVAREKKRAFGARTAKMESGKVKGTTLLS